MTDCLCPHRYIKDKMENAKRIKGLTSLNVTPKREVQSENRNSMCVASLNSLALLSFSLHISLPFLAP